MPREDALPVSQVCMLLAILFILIIVSVRLRRERFFEVLPAQLGVMGQAILGDGAITTVDDPPCIIAGQPMADSFRAPSVQQADIDRNSCVVSTSIPGIADACDDKSSSLHSPIVTGVQLVPSRDPQNMDCMITFKGALWTERTEDNRRALYNYNLANDWKAREALLRQANDALVGQTALLGQQIGQLTALNQSLELSLSSTKSQLSSTQGQLSSTQDQLSQTQGQLSSTQGKLSQTDLALRGAQSNISMTQQLLSMAQQSNTSVSASLQQQIGELTTQLQSNMQTVSSLSAMKTALEEDLSKEKTMRATSSLESAQTIAQLTKQLQELQRQAATQQAAAGPAIDYKPGLAIDVWQVENIGSQYVFASKKFSSYGTKLLDMDIINFDLVGDAFWSSDSWLNHQIGFDIYGFLEIPATKAYTFYVVTDDGVQIWVDNQMVFDKWWATPSVVYESPAMPLRQGRVPFRLRWYEWYGAKQLRVGWDGPGISAMFNGQRTVNLIKPESFSYVAPATPQILPTPTAGPDFPNWSVVAPSGKTMQPAVGHTPLRSFDSLNCTNDRMTIAFWLQICGRNTAWRSILAVTKATPSHPGGGMRLRDIEDAAAGWRRPAIWIGNDNRSYLHITSSTGKDSNHAYNTPDLPMNEKTLVVINWQGRDLTVWIYNRQMKWKGNTTYSADLWPAHGQGCGVFMGQNAWGNVECNNYCIRDLRYFNLRLSDDEVALMYQTERTGVDVNNTACAAR
jgi:hypothetical protein